MDIIFDLRKDEANQRKHGVSLVLACALDWDRARIWEDRRNNYGEERQTALGLIRNRVYVAVFVDRGGKRRIISLRKTPPKGDRKVTVSMCIDPQVLIAFQSTGQGWQNRMADVLHAYAKTQGLLPDKG